jgi:hypothetical protein
VCQHLTRPASNGLFSHAIMESGGCDGPWLIFDGNNSKEWGSFYAEKVGATHERGFIQCACDSMVLLLLEAFTVFLNSRLLQTLTDAYTYIHTHAHTHTHTHTRTHTNTCTSQVGCAASLAPAERMACLRKKKVDEILEPYAEWFCPVKRPDDPWCNRSSSHAGKTQAPPSPSRVDSWPGEWPTPRPPLAPIVGWAPTLDGTPEGLPDTPYHQMLKGNVNRAPDGSPLSIIFGTNKDELAVFIIGMGVVVPGSARSRARAHTHTHTHNL